MTNTHLAFVRDCFKRFVCIISSHDNLEGNPITTSPHAAQRNQVAKPVTTSRQLNPGFILLTSTWDTYQLHLFSKKKMKMKINAFPGVTKLEL
jgi:hypothetical protein